MSSTHETHGHKDHLSVLQKARSRSKGTVTRIRNQIKELMWDLNNVEEVRRKVTELEVALREFFKVHQNYHSLLKTDTEKKESTEYYAAEERKVTDMLFTIDIWIESAHRKLEESLHPEVNPEDSISNVASNSSFQSKSSKPSSKSSKKSSNVTSNISKESKKSSNVASNISKESKSKKSSVYSRSSSRNSSLAGARRTALQAELSTLSMRQSLEMEQLKIRTKYKEDQLSIRQKQNELLLKTELAKFTLSQDSQQPPVDIENTKNPDIGMSTNKSVVSRENELSSKIPCFDNIQFESTPQSKEHKPTNEFTTPQTPNPTSDRVNSSLNPNSNPWEPKQRVPSYVTASHDCVTDSHLRQMQEMQNNTLQQLLNQQREQAIALTLPPQQLPTFSGDALEYCDFIRAFENLIEAKITDSSSRLYYLIQYTEADVKQLMKSCVAMSPELGYDTARKLLKDKYGQHYKIATAYVERVTNMPNIKAEDGPGLQRYSVALISCKNMLKEIGYVNKIENPDSLLKIIGKLPFNLRARWRDVADDITEVKKREITIEDVSSFIESKARAANHPIFGTAVNESKHHDVLKGGKERPMYQPRRATTYSTLNQNDFNAVNSAKPTVIPTPETSSNHHGSANAQFTVQQHNQASTFATQVCSTQPSDTKYGESKPKLTCYMCDGGHWLSRCEHFKGKSVEERQKFVRDKRLCDNCLHYGHFAKSCPKESFCKVADCKFKHRKHSTYLHPRINDSATTKEPGTFGDPTSNSTTKENLSSKNSYVNVDKGLCTATGAGTLRTGLAIVPVKVKSANNDSVIETYAFLDSGSNCTLCTEGLLNRLGINGEDATLSLTTMDHENEKSDCKMVSLIVSDLLEENTVELPCVFTRKKLPVSEEDIPRQEDVNRWQHLSEISLTEIDSDVELLIGNDVPRALEPREVKLSQDGGPYAVRTLLGWTINGPLRSSKDLHHKVNRIHADAELNLQFEQFCNREFNDSSNDINKSMSQEDMRALRIMENTATLNNGHYELSLPWRVYPPDLSNNKVLVERRLSMLKKRLTKDQQLHRKYTEFMNSLTEKGYSQLVPEDHLTEMPKWYLPHHPVEHPHKPEKVRVVFDCASKFQDKSINDCLMQGPNLTNTLVGVMTRFRMEQFAVMGDIESMFYQVRVSPDDRTYLRYLWWPNGDMSQEPREYQMLVHLFGGASSPSCASFGLRKTAEDNKNDFDDQTIKVVNDNFYVDDCLASVEREDEAIRLVDQLRKLLSKGGFRLTKWISNSRRVIESVPESERASSVKELDLDHLPTERALGILWNVEQDVFSFKITIKDAPSTRRGILSVISSIYDPLGFVSPVLLPAKELLQELCKQGFSWDDQLSPEHQRRWNSWLNQLPDLQDLTINRCFKPKNFGTIVSTQLHNFADASQKGYGAASYLRIVNTAGDIHCALVMAKSRLTPIKAITIPRLELSSAVVATRLSCMIHQELNATIDETYFWTDSTCVLGYILNQEKRFHTFVANRIASIHNGSETHQWHHVDTSTNPADDASRGLTAKELINNKRWICGPSFLWKDEREWPKTSDALKKVSDDDVEVKTESKVAAVTISDKSTDVIERIFNYFSSWYRLKKCIAWLLRYRANLLLAAARRKNNEVLTKPNKEISPLTVQELQSAELQIVRFVQRKNFHDEMSPTTFHTKKSSPIYKLHPQIVDGILRVGGRLRNASIEENAKHQIIIPGNHHISILIARYYHACAGHSGIEHTLSNMRQVYWLVKARVIVRKVINQCIKCKRRQAPPETQRMADLPVDRVTHNKPPFTYVGVDCFGPFMVKRARSLVKRYGVLYTCLTIRAIHIEIVHTMETDSFINSLRRFIARRGRPELIRSDNGTNFVGGNNELTRALREWNQEQINEFLLQRNIQWKFNPPAASHQGGVWERCIRTVRKVLNSLLQEQTLDDEGLSTLMCEVESIINNRPVTKSSDDPRDAEALTPNHLLLLRPSPNLPPGIFCKEDNYSRRRWRQVQYMSNVFWSRWLREYLPQLQQRQKWLKSSKNLKVDDVVLVVDDKLPRSIWPLGRVTEVRRNSQDGCVRSVTVKTKNSVYTRPITKIVLLESL